MQLNDVDQDRLRTLAALRPPQGKVLSVYLDLDPATFGTHPARAVQIGSLLDEADRRTRDQGLTRDVQTALRHDVARVRDYLLGGGFTAKGAHAVALFACGPAGLFEVLRLPTAVPPTVVVNDAPWLAPLVHQPRRRRRCLALVSRRTLRVLLDDSEGALREVAELVDDVHGRHDRGGLSQARYQRSIEADVHEHLARSAATLFALLRREPFELLAVGATTELWPEVEHALHPYLREHTVGRFDVDVEHASVEEALTAAQPLFATHERRAVERLLERLHAGLASGERAAAGLAPVQAALAERRVETLLWSDDREADEALHEALRAALTQSADVVALGPRPELGPHGGIAALLRF